MLKNHMNYSSLKHQILIALRGPLSQMELSRKLGFSFNQVGKWESGATQFKWTDFYDLCEVTGVSVTRAMLEVFLYLDEDARDPVKVLNALHVFHSSYSFDKLAKALNCHVSVVRRWFSGAVCPSLESVLALMNLRQNFLLLFLSKITDMDKLPAVTELFIADEKLRSVEYRDPGMELIQLVLKLEDYKLLPEHSDDYISYKTGFSLKDVEIKIQKLLETNLIVWENGKLINNNFQFSNITGDVHSFVRFQKYWMEKMLSRFDTPSGLPTKKNKEGPSYQGCIMFTASNEETVQIFNLLNKCFEDIRQLNVGKGNPEQAIRVLNINFFDPEDVPMPAELHSNSTLAKPSDLPSSESVLQ
jgi:DNA-binding transcriptional regulator YiaG